MDVSRFQTLAARFGELRIALVGDFCLDRYFDIDFERQETSLETGLPVFNVTGARASAGGCGTILNNLVALGIGELLPIGFAGNDAEGWLLTRLLQQKPGVNVQHFVQTDERHTFTYMKPMASNAPGGASELNRMDVKNWSPTPEGVSENLAASVRTVGEDVDAVIVLDQVDLPGTGVVTDGVLEAIETVQTDRPELFVIADSRSSLDRFPPVVFKMNRDELARTAGPDATRTSSLDDVRGQALQLARRNNRHVIVTLAEEGMLGASPTGECAHVAALPVRGEIDVVGAGDAVTANLTAAFATGGTLSEALHAATAAASVVVHKRGMTGEASVAEICELLPN
ncbi:MAG: carbohydrate kinase [Planctomycetaceae bacterium]|nr:carbohydrate kinase [Planctomycetaceae bacterium]